MSRSKSPNTGGSLGRPTTAGANTSTLGGLGNQAEISQLRKQLIQEKAKCQDFKEQVEEQNSLYIKAIKERDQAREEQRSAKSNMTNWDSIIQKKVNDAVAEKNRELVRLKKANEQFEQKERMLDEQISQLQNELKNWKEENASLKMDLQAHMGTGEAKNFSATLETLRKEKASAIGDKDELMAQINQLSNQMEDILAENKQLRSNANVPDNFGVQVENIKLHNKEKIEDFKKLIKVLQDDNYKLESERAQLKHKLKIQSTMYTSEAGLGGGQRYAGLSESQIFEVDQFVMRLKSGDSTEQGREADIWKRKYEELKNNLETQNHNHFDKINNSLAQIVAGNVIKKGANDSGIDLRASQEQSNQMQKIMADNEELRKMIQKVLDQGPRGSDLPNMPSRPGYMQNSKSNYRPPLPHHAGINGEISEGTSYLFDNTNLNVIDKEGMPGLSTGSLHEQAFLQLCLQECLEQIHRKDLALANQNQTVQHLHERHRKYLLTQEQLYKDFVRLERSHAKEKGEWNMERKKLGDQVLEEQTKCSNLEKLTKTTTTESIKQRLIEMTSTNSLLEVNLMKLTRKYQVLEEQEQLLRRQYNSQDEEQAEKDRFMHERINQLKEWKVNALHQIDTLYTKLKLAVPVSELQKCTLKLQVAQQKLNDLAKANARQARCVSDLNKKLRDQVDAEEKVNQLIEQRDDCEEECEILKRRLETFDPVFRFESQVFSKIASVINRSNMSVKQVFESLDSDKNGVMDNDEFKRALGKLGIVNLSHSEIKVLFNSIDTDRSGSIEMREFTKKLERYGVKNRSSEEIIIVQMIEALDRSDIEDFSELFQVMDKLGTGFITRQDFRDVFDRLPIKINNKELEKFMDSFWRDKDAGIDYQGFLRIFSRHQVRMAKQGQAKKIRAPVSEDIIRTKKRIFEEIQSALNANKRSLKNLYDRVDTSGDGFIDANELNQMFQDMRLRVTKAEAMEIYNTIDFDGDGQISFPEFASDFNNTINRPIESILADERAKAATHQNMQDMDYAHGVQSNIPQSQLDAMNAQTRIETFKAREKQLLAKVDMAMKIQEHANKQCNELKNYNDKQDAELQKLQKENQKMKEQMLVLETERQGMVRQDKAFSLDAENEMLRTELTKTKAGMLSYKHMTQVIGEQARNLKLQMERRKDEHDNLINALRDLQSESIDKERMGKLYFIIMLSRWQEAAVNKKYDQQVQHVKELRNEVLNTGKLANAYQDQLHQKETEFSGMVNKMEELRLQAGNNYSEQNTRDNTAELSATIAQLSEAKNELEEEYMKMRIECRSAKDKLDTAMAKADMSKQLVDQLRLEKDSDLSNRLVEMSRKLEGIRISEYQATRIAAEKEERVKFYANLVKQKNDQLANLEQHAARCEADMEKEKENFRTRENDRLQKFFYKKGDNMFSVDAPKPYQSRFGGNSGIDKLQRASSMTTQLQGHQLSEQTVHTHDAIQRMNTHQDGPGSSAQQAKIDDQTKRIEQLQNDVKRLAQQLNVKEGDIKQLEQWQVSDKYLTQDEQLKGLVEQHRAKNIEATDKEAREMAEAAQCTINTLQEMVEDKNKAMARKEEQIVKLRANMANAREQDSRTIQDLRNQLAAHGNTTLSKMHEIVSKQNVAHSQAPRSYAADAYASEDLNRKLSEKDNKIHLLNQKFEAIKGEASQYNKKSSSYAQQVMDLKEELRVAKLKLDKFNLDSQKIDRLQKERNKQNDTIEKLTKAIDALRGQMFKLEAEKVKNEDKVKTSSLKEEKQVDVVRKELENVKFKWQQAISSRDIAQGEVSQLKIQVTDLENQVKALTADAATKAPGKVNSFATGGSREAQLEKKVRELEAKLGQQPSTTSPLKTDFRSGTSGARSSSLSGAGQTQAPAQQEPVMVSQMLTNQEAESLFEPVVGQSWNQDSVTQLNTLMSEAFKGVKVMLVDKVRDKLKADKKFLQPATTSAIGYGRQQQVSRQEFIDKLTRDINVKFSKKQIEDIQYDKVAIAAHLIPSGGGQSVVSNQMDMVPSKGQSSSGKTTTSFSGNKNSEFEKCREIARNVLISVPQVADVLSAKDPNDEGLLDNDTVARTISEKRPHELDLAQMNMLIAYVDKQNRGFVAIPAFANHLQELSKETDKEVVQRRFAKTVGQQAIILTRELSNFDISRKGTLDKHTFKRALKQMPVSLSDSEIDQLFESAVNPDTQMIDIKEFSNQIKAASQQKALPQALTIQSKPGSKVTKIGAGASNATQQNSAFENWELEKKYKKNLEALKNEIEERNREIQLTKAEVKDSKERVLRLEQEKQALEKRIVERHDRPPMQLRQESGQENLVEEVHRQKDEIFHLQKVNQQLTKTIQVDLKSELGRLTSEKEQLEGKVKTLTQRLWQKNNEFNQLVGKPMDELVRREEREEARQKAIEILQSDNEKLEKELQEVQDQLFKTQERTLDLKFEKETFDLSYARLQKRISDLEHYKLQSSQLSAQLQQQHENELAEIQNETAKLRGDALAGQPGETVKLRKRSTTKSAAELEAVIEQLKRVIEKQKIENEKLTKNRDHLEALQSKRSNEPKLRMRIEQLERQVHSYEMQEVNVDEKDQTIKKLVFANKQLRDDLQREIDRFTLLESKFKEMLVKYNIKSKEMDKSQKALFTMTTGAQMDRYGDFLDDKANQRSRMTDDPGHKKSKVNDDFDEGFQSDDSLNNLNRREAGRTQ